MILLFVAEMTSLYQLDFEKPQLDCVPWKVWSRSSAISRKQAERSWLVWFLKKRNATKWKWKLIQQKDGPKIYIYILYIWIYLYIYIANYIINMYFELLRKFNHWNLLQKICLIIWCTHESKDPKDWPKYIFWRLAICPTWVQTTPAPVSL